MLKRVLAITFSLTVAAGFAAHCFIATALGQDQNATRQREVRANPAEVTVTLNEQFFNTLLDTIFRDLKAPTFPLALASVKQQKNPASHTSSQTQDSLNLSAFSLSHVSLRPDACESVVTLERETSGVRTAVRFENGRVVAPLAFKGAYSIAIIGCVYFQGWADTVINLSFDRQRQVLSARVAVVDIHLNNIPSLASGMVIRLVQNSLDSRINPIEILQAAQLSTRIPVTGTGGALRLRATEIRPEVVPGALSLHIFYEFAPAE